ncbi:quinolinate synthase [candidate division WOR-3 bacterium JGI_Cruoil_03_51_56]|uniref:Quinolinate synthase n=1 Tax=candidate division WOR-3 bacterium JGI_Cruoil_03_51_56 TaxID=1973747 RepID=A0A235BT65_UNCW3|nr:MAG: quinolinate synthase [candidate division WOR-3 bacterium JGI_Cruoil_03_51_56]
MIDSKLIAEIKRLKQKKNAIILVHNYQPAEIFKIADFIGDSLELSRKAAQSGAPLILFCGVRFMAETAKLLSPDSRVIMPEPKAGCELADEATSKDLRNKKKALGDVVTVTYVNTTAEVKAESDICCTSANAVRVVKTLPRGSRVLFVPDKNLAAYVAQKTNYEIIPWPGSCYVHACFTAFDVRRARRKHPGAVVISHPESPPDVLAASDYVASTGGMLKLAKECDEIVLGTDAGMCARIQYEYPGKKCYPLKPDALCRNMKRTTLGKAMRALKDETGEVTVPQGIAEKARAAIERMMAVN